MRSHRTLRGTRAAVGTIEDLVTIVPSDMRTVWLARKMRKHCADFEDCLILAACELAETSFFVTNDIHLRKAAPVKAGSPEDILPYL